MAIEKPALIKLLQSAFDSTSDKKVKPVDARKQMAVDIADAIEAYIIGRETIVTGSSATGGPVSGTGVIQ